MQSNVIASGIPTNGATGRAVRGLFGLGVTVAIVLGAAGAAAAASMGTAGLLPPGAQDVFDQVVSDSEPLRAVGVEATDQGEAPGVPAVITSTPVPTGDAPARGLSDDEGEDADSRHESGTGNSGHNNGIGSSGEDNGFGNSGKHNGTPSDDDSDESEEDSKGSDLDSDESTGKSHAKNGGSGENNSGGNSSKDDD
ncbi:hypothetical protein SAMN06296378_2300 [Salinibacterium xinjiangense]|uniref:Uncharacterized protein n=2 Tax=Salinibacterium xinjiangense TaxID=386302 RepID=A0A2C8ZXG4_9MICO|nr:hypothetical protein SAMN06296378_2300 [Salinibacterium xinjiangense]